MIILDETTKSVEAVLGGAVATNQPAYVCHFVDLAGARYEPGEQDGVLNSTTDVTIVAAPSSGMRRQVKLITIYNADTAPVIQQVHYDNNGTERTMIRVTLAVGSTLEYTDGAGWKVITALGAIIQVTGITELTGDVTAGPGTGAQAATVKANLKIEPIDFTIDGAGVAITTGVKGYLRIPFACTITAAVLLADQTGSIVIDIWKDTYANYPPVNADSITAAAPPTISAADKSKDTTLTGWTTAIAADDVLGFNVDSAATVTKVHVQLQVVRT